MTDHRNPRDRHETQGDDMLCGMAHAMGCGILAEPSAWDAGTDAPSRRFRPRKSASRPIAARRA